MCPGKKLGKVDILHVRITAGFRANSPALFTELLSGAIMDKGAKKAELQRTGTYSQISAPGSLLATAFFEEGGRLPQTCFGVHANPDGPDAPTICYYSASRRPISMS